MHAARPSDSARLARLARLASSLAALGIVVGCAQSAASGPLAGASDAWSTRPAHRAHPPQPSIPRPEATLDAGAQSWPLASPEPFTTRGHLPAQRVDVRANETALSAYRELVPDAVFADGSGIALLARGGAGLGYLMRKSAGTWQYFQLDALGRIRPGSAPSLCAACHSQAGSDHVFGLPR